jgi:hypothetical protein
MAPKRKPRLAERAGRGHQVSLRLPDDVFERIEAEAKAQGRPMNRIIVNDLAAIPWLRSQAKLAETVRDMEIVLAKYGSRITLSDLNEQLLAAVDETLAAQSEGELLARVDKLRVTRLAMRTHQRDVKPTLDAYEQSEKARIDAYKQSEG